MLDMINIDLKRLIKEKGKSTRSLAIEVGIGYTTLLNIRERGTIKPNDYLLLEQVVDDFWKYIN